MQTSIDVLVIDDSDTDARDTLLGIRYALPDPSITRLKDGDVALQFLLRHGLFKDRPPVLPRLILLELDTPLIHGLDLLKHLRRVSATRDIPVVVFTRTRTPVAIEDAYAAGAQVYRAKPLDRTEYINEVARLVIEWLPRDPTPP